MSWCLLSDVGPELVSHTTDAKKKSALRKDFRFDYFLVNPSKISQSGFWAWVLETQVCTEPTQKEFHNFAAQAHYPSATGKRFQKAVKINTRWALGIRPSGYIQSGPEKQR